MCSGGEHREEKGKPYSCQYANADQITCFFRGVLNGWGKKLEKCQCSDAKAQNAYSSGHHPRCNGSASIGAADEMGNPKPIRPISDQHAKDEQRGKE
jgi:hypothetical protein